MASSVNKVILIGNLGGDPEIRTFQNGGRVANLSVATSESWKDNNSGERRERTEWHRVVMFNEVLAEARSRVRYAHRSGHTDYGTPNTSEIWG